MKTAKEFLAATDSEIYEVYTGERRRQEEGIELIASENVVAPAVLAALGSVENWHCQFVSFWSYFFSFFLFL